MKRIATIALLGVSAFAHATGTAQAGHLFLDHPAPSFSTTTPVPAFQAGGPGASWELLATFPTGNPHTDVDFFTQGGDTFMSAGTLAAGPNGGGQTILRLTERGAVRPTSSPATPPRPASANPLPRPGSSTTSSPRPRVRRFSTRPTLRRPPGHPADRGRHGRRRAVPRPGHARPPERTAGRLEIVDVTVPTRPVEIGLTSHIGEAHTVNVDPKRPHIAYAVTSDSVSVDANGKRLNETAAERLALDGFEVVDMSSCMNFPASATVQQRRDGCRPEVYRYRFPSAQVALGHTLKSTIYACHETEIYADDRLALR